jgi:hypothetical protein
LPNVSEFHRVLTRAEDHLDQACLIYLTISLSDLDLSLLIADADVRLLYIEAQSQAHDRKYREALETLARAMGEVGRTAPMYIGAGHADSEVALQLTAYGVDPGAFIRMQQFLPALGLDEPKWDTRSHGHRGNWRGLNISFCLATFLDLVLKLQYAEYQPSAVQFSVLFDDVITARRDGVAIQSQFYHPLFPVSDWQQKEFGEMKAGQRILGHLIPAFRSGTFKWKETNFDIADLYVMEHPKMVDTQEPIPENTVLTVLIVKAEDVTWSYQERAGVRKYLPHFFDAEMVERE